MYKLTLAKTAGFCFGVRRAVDRAFRLAGEGTDAVTLGPIIHNPQVVERLAGLGLRPVDLSLIHIWAFRRWKRHGLRYWRSIWKTGCDFWA